MKKLLIPVILTVLCSSALIDVSATEPSETSNISKNASLYITKYYGTCDNVYRYYSFSPADHMEYGCDTTGVDEVFSYYRKSTTSDYSAAVKSGSKSWANGSVKSDNELSKVQQSYNTASDKYFGMKYE